MKRIWANLYLPLEIKIFHHLSSLDMTFSTDGLQKDGSQGLLQERNQDS